VTLVPGHSQGTKDKAGASSAAGPAPSMRAPEVTRFHVKKTVIVGNTSKYLLPHTRDPGNQATHKWWVADHDYGMATATPHFVYRATCTAPAQRFSATSCPAR
jgi:hypothetical protein